ncbi:MAG: hypothetical protein FWG65_11130 [Turicibacter sp.]|nr:hypothetical protein [Turicibacter sp.]
MTEQVLAILPTSTAENDLKTGISNYEKRAANFQVATEEDYKQATIFARELKTMAARVTEFWKPKKDAAHKAHKEICTGEKSMITPIQNAIATIKSKIGEFTQEQERQRQIEEAAAIKIMLEERDRMLEVAVKADTAGNTQTANYALAQAQAAETTSKTFIIEATTPKVAGISQSRDWEIEEITPAEVPIDWGGAVIRPVDEKAVMRLIRASKGQIEIPGIKFKEVVKTAIRKVD